jgi:4-deoxy-L-threo-5-hexosulose-uronate ketol-isomerase
MNIRHSSGSEDAKLYDTQRLRSEYLIEDLFKENEIQLTYSHFDRIIIGSIVPKTRILTLEAGEELRSEYFLERREMGIINIGDTGSVTVDGTAYCLGTRDALYIGMGAKTVSFTSANPEHPAKFYLNSAPAHQAYPTVKIEINETEPTRLGTPETSNQRTIYKYIHPQGVKSCQLVMGMTQLERGSVWNTMPCHTHERRMEVYLYFDMQADNLVFHFMGNPQETRHIVVRNEQAVISPSWSIHSGAGTRHYTFVWGMCGENQTFTDMDGVSLADIL